jgi:hypothetical protein
MVSKIDVFHCTVPKMLIRKILRTVSNTGIYCSIVAVCSPVKIKGPFGGTYRLHIQGRGVSKERNEHEISSKQISSCCLPAYYSTLKMEVICSSETLVDFHRTTRRCNSRDINLRRHSCENLNPKLRVCSSVMILNLIIQNEKPMKFVCR